MATRWLQWLRRIWPFGNDEERPAEAPARTGPTLGLALGGGGVRGAAHIGVLDCFLQNGLAPDLIAGTSAGSIAGVLYALGLSPKTMMQELTQLDRSTIVDLALSKVRMVPLGSMLLFAMLGLSTRGRKSFPRGIIKGNRFERWISELVGAKTFADLRIPTYTVATDLHSAKTVVMGAGRWRPDNLPADMEYMADVPVDEAVRASISIPLLFEPKQLDGRILVDGVVTEPVPAQVARVAGADIVVAVDLGLGGPTSSGFEGLLAIFNRSIAIGGQKYSDMKLSRYADLIIQPQTTEARLTDLQLIPEFVEWGYKAAEEVVPRVKQLLDMDAAPGPQSRRGMPLS